MKIVIRTTEHEIPIESLKEKTVSGLFEKIEEVCDCKDKINSIYTKDKKLSREEGSKLEDFGITDDSRILVLIKKGDANTKKAETSSKSSSNSGSMGNNPYANMNPNMGNNPYANMGNNPYANMGSNPYANMGNNPYANMGNNPYANMGNNPYANMSGNMFPGMNPNMGNSPYGNMGPQINESIIQNLFKNPETFDMTIDTVFPGLTPEQKKVCREELQNMKNNNPQQWNALLNKATGMATNKYGMGWMNNGMGGMNNGMGGMNNGMAGSPMMPYGNMGSPMHNGMAGMNPMFNPMMQQEMANRNNSVPPKDGPCSHGFYPPVIVDGKPVGQSADILFGNQLKELSDMGFNDKELNKKLLFRFAGNLPSVLEELLKLSGDKK